MIWFNPPYNSYVKTEIGAKFLKLIQKYFHKDNPLKKIFNRNTLKIGYKCAPNLDKIISGHNSKILKEENPQGVGRKCNCRRGGSCPLDGNCLQTNLVYQATVSHEGGAEELGSLVFSQNAHEQCK